MANNLDTVQLSKKFKILHEEKVIQVMFAAEFDRAFKIGNSKTKFQKLGHDTLKLKDRKTGASKLVIMDKEVKVCRNEIDKLTIIYRRSVYETMFIGDYAKKEEVSRTMIQKRVAKSKLGAIRIPYGSKKLMLIITKAYEYNGGA